MPSLTRHFSPSPGPPRPPPGQPVYLTACPHGEKRWWQEARTFTQPQRHWFLTLSGHDLDSWGPLSQKTTHLDMHSKFCVQGQLHSGHLCSPPRLPVQGSLVLCPHLEILNLFWPRHVACGILVPQPAIEPLAVQSWNPNHWTLQGSPLKFFFFLFLTFEQGAPHVPFFNGCHKSRSLTCLCTILITGV